MYIYILKKPILSLLNATVMTASVVMHDALKKKKERRFKDSMRMERKFPFNIK